jgi:hypothetical protein
MRKVLKILVVVILVLANAAALALAVFSFTGEIDFGRKQSNRPNIGEKLNLTIPEDPEELKTFAYELYALANKNFKELENAAYSVNSTTTMQMSSIKLPVYGHRYFVKNGADLLYLDYSFVTNPAVATLMGFMAKDTTMYAERCFTTGDIGYMYAEKTLEPTFTLGENSVTYNADWNNLYYAKQKDKPIYHAGQTEDFEYTDQLIRPETIKNAEVTYVKSEGYYRLVLDLDVDNPLTTSKTQPNLRQSSGAADAHYTYMRETIEIWDNGYFKYFLSVDHWEGQGVVFMKSIIEYETVFLYDEASLNFSNYQYADELISMVRNNQMRSK